MLQFLDDHCRAENVKLNREEKENKDSMSAYDFFYLPIDFRCCCLYPVACIDLSSVFSSLWIFEVVCLVVFGVLSAGLAAIEVLRL